MEVQMKPGPAVTVIFGAAGDLTHRKLLPALFNLFLDGWLPERFAVLGIDQREMSDDAFREHLKQGVDSFSRSGKADPKDWSRFSSHLTFLAGDFTAEPLHAALADRLNQADQSLGDATQKPVHVFYLATPPTLVGPIVGHLGKAGLIADRKLSRVVVEKPFGRDLDSASALNHLLTSVLSEPQIFRIDHYLGKETVQNLLAFRFANGLFEPVWDRRYIDHVQITVAETVGVEHRGGYYDQAGALRDMVQNHLMQLLCLVAMEPPVSFGADEIRNKKLDVLRAIRPILGESVDKNTVRGQYGPGRIDNQQVPGYRQEPDVAPDSATETYAALKLGVDNWRWQDVPFYLRTGKRLPEQSSQIAIHFLRVPHRAFPESAGPSWPPNQILIHIQPEEGITLRLQAKRPGPAMQLAPVDMHFLYKEAFQSPSPEAYETLLLDVMRGDATQFMRADQVEAAWSLITPILTTWAASKPTDFPNYPAGSAGPQAAEDLLARDGRSWTPLPDAPPKSPQTPEQPPPATPGPTS